MASLEMHRNYLSFWINSFLASTWALLRRIDSETQNREFADHSLWNRAILTNHLHKVALA